MNLLRRLWLAWERFFFAPQSPLPIAVFRILYGICVTATLLLLHPMWLAWYGTESWVSRVTMSVIEPGPRLSLFAVLPQSDAWVMALFWFALISAILLTLGLFTRISTIAVFLCLTSIQQRNLFILNGGDTFLRLAGFFLIFAPAGAALSLDHVIRRWRRREGRTWKLYAPWAQRMIQFELCLLYFSAFLWKMQGSSWRNGTALFYVAQLQAMQRFPVPAWLHSPVLLHLGTWYTLVLELGLSTLLWFRPFRAPLLVLGLLFHLALEYSLNIPMFEWDVLTAYVLFLSPESLERIGRWFQGFGPFRARRPIPDAM